MRQEHAAPGNSGIGNRRGRVHQGQEHDAPGNSVIGNRRYRGHHTSGTCCTREQCYREQERQRSLGSGTYAAPGNSGIGNSIDRGYPGIMKKFKITYIRWQY